MRPAWPWPSSVYLQSNPMNLHVASLIVIDLFGLLLTVFPAALITLHKDKVS
jgi:hypothetical protein